MTFVVPSLGASHYLKDCLESAAASEGARVEILLVHPPAMEPRFESVPGLKLVATHRRVGFSQACNLGIAESTSEYVALLNDDATIEPDWASTLIAALSATPRAAAAQGLNLQMLQPDRVDGRGLEWNRSWQAIQKGHGDTAPTVSLPAEETFGVSATAALYKRAALDAVALADSEFFDVRLESYYEDVDLACRLRAAGYTAPLGTGSAGLSRQWNNHQEAAHAPLQPDLWQSVPGLGSNPGPNVLEPPPEAPGPRHARPRSGSCRSRRSKICRYPGWLGASRDQPQPLCQYG